MTSKERNNWRYLVIAVQNPQGGYINAKSKRYAAAIVAAAVRLDELEKAYSKTLDSVVESVRERARNEN